MEFSNEFTVPTDIDSAWTILTDISQIAPCLPGATLEPRDDEYFGAITVKVGPIKTTYAGIASFRELDRDSWRIVLDALGKENSGKGGSASATVIVILHDEDRRLTRVSVETSLQITGKIAQFGRDAMAGVGAQLIAQFASNLEKILVSKRLATTLGPSDDEAVRDDVSPSIGSAVRNHHNINELDALDLAMPTIKRSIPTVGAFTFGVLITWLIGRMRKFYLQVRYIEGSE